MQERTIGILGGMGPEATVDLMQRVLRATPARDDEDHVRLVVDNNPKVPSRIKALIEGRGEDPVPCLQDMARRLEAWGVDLLAMPCNTAHYYHQKIQCAVGIPLLNMLDLAARAVAEGKPGIRSAGILASTAVLDLELYTPWFAGHGLRLLAPGDRVQSKVMQAIKTIKTGRCDQDLLEGLQAATEDLEAQGAEALLIACTEISVIAGSLRPGLDCFDASQVLAEAIVAQAKGIQGTAATD